MPDLTPAEAWEMGWTFGSELLSEIAETDTSSPEGELPPLYHYTDAVGLTGIATSRELWATRAGFSNDVSEMRLLRSAFRNIPDARLFIANVAPADIQPRVYLFCLSELGDDLSQWRGYCPRSGGYALGFERQALEEWIGPIKRDGGEVEGTLKVVRCLYAEREKYEQLAVRMVSGYRALEGPVLDRRDEWFKGAFCAVAGRIKDSHFEREREWRLVIYAPGRDLVHHRGGEFTPIPYYKYDFSGTLTRPFTSVFVGPNPYQDLAQAGAQSLGDTVTDFSTRLSRIPYRSLW